MFVGHYAAALAGKSTNPIVPLWVLFVAVQFVDFLWAGFILTGIEEARLVPGFVEASDADLYHMPYSHSLVASVFWSVVFATGYQLIARPEKKLAAALLTGGAVMSHWLTDFIVHVPDLPLLYGEPKVGLGLWRSLLWSQVVEIGLLVLGTIWFVARTDAKGIFGRISPWLVLFLLVALQGVSHIPSEEVIEIEAFAVRALAVFTVIAGLGALLDISRAGKAG